MNELAQLQELGWSPFLQQQLTLEEFEGCRPARVMAQHRSLLELATGSADIELAIVPAMPPVVVGDWLLLNQQNHFLRLLERFSLFSRKAAGSRVQEQLIAANVDTVFLVTSSNHDFNPSRLERYLALVHDAGAEPVIVITKADLSEEVQAQTATARALDPMVMVEAVDARSADSVTALSPWVSRGKTILFLGSSGVGKSTLVNSLLGSRIQATSGIREDDSKGRHTTTGRSLHLIDGGGLLLDTPGMRELQLADVEGGIERTFADISALAQQCRFGDCAHDTEPGCAVMAAVAAGELDERRLDNYRKLLREQALNSASLAEKRSRDKALGKFYRSVQSESRRLKEGD